MDPDEDDLDIIELLEVEEAPEPEPAEPWLGYHEPDYSLKPDRVIPLDKTKYTSYNKALLRFAEIADKYNLKLHKTIETARHFVFEAFYIVEDGNEQ